MAWRHTASAVGRTAIPASMATHPTRVTATCSSSGGGGAPEAETTAYRCRKRSGASFRLLSTAALRGAAFSTPRML